MGITHRFVSTVPDVTDPSLVRPSAWNDTHAIGDISFPNQVAITGEITPDQLVADQNDWNPTNLATASIIRVSTDASRNLTGLAGITGGRLIFLINIGSFPLVLKHDSANSSAENRFYLPGNLDLTLQPNEFIVLVYDNTSTRWHVSGDSRRASSLNVPISRSSVIPVGIVNYAIRIKGNYVITGWAVYTDASGAGTLDIWKSTHAAYPPVVGNSIIGVGTKPTTGSARKNSGAVSDWTTTTLSDGDVLIINVDSNAANTWLTLVLDLQRID